jgi:protein TonB
VGAGPSGAGGSPLALASPGNGSGAAPAEYGPYLARFRRRVQETLVYPLAARRQGLGGAVELDVWLEASGRIRDVRVVRSSSHALLDEAALETIRRLGPLPFPDSLPRRPLLIRLPLVFELR